MTNNTKAILAILAAAFFTACNYVLVKLLGKTFSPISLAYLRVGIGMFFLFLLFHSSISFKRLVKISKKQFFLFFLSGALGFGLYFYCATIALTKTLVVNVTFIESCLPIVVYMYTIFLLKEKFKLGYFFTAALSIYGALVIATRSFIPTLSQFKIGEFFALLDTFLLAVSFVGRKMLSKDFNTQEVSFMFMLFAFVTLIGIGAVIKDNLIFADFTVYTVFLTIMNGLILAMAVLSTNYALKYISPTLVGQLNLTKIIFAFVLSFIFFREIPGLYSIIGGSLIVGGVYISQKYFS